MYCIVHRVCIFPGIFMQFSLATMESFVYVSGLCISCRSPGTDFPCQPQHDLHVRDIMVTPVEFMCWMRSLGSLKARPWQLAGTSLPDSVRLPTTTEYTSSTATQRVQCTYLDLNYAHEPRPRHVCIPGNYVTLTLVNRLCSSLSTHRAKIAHASNHPCRLISCYPSNGYVSEAANR